jgi:hypothetical protein
MILVNGDVSSLHVGREDIMDGDVDLLHIDRNIYMMFSEFHLYSCYRLHR